MKWEEKTLDELIDINKKSLGKDYAFTHINYYDISSVGTGIIKNINSIKIEDAPSRAKRIIQNGDTIISTVRPINRSFYYCKSTNINDIASTGFAVLTAKENQIDSRFLYYTISSQSFTNYLVSNEQGATYPSITPKIIKKAKIKLPPLKTQKKIAKILSNYDDLIENNLKQIKLLEEKARLTYEEWFLRFRVDGVRLEIDSDSGLPFGWENIKLKDTGIKFIDGDRGKNYPKHDDLFKEGYCLFLNTKNVTKIGFDFSETLFITKEKDNLLRNGRLKQKDIVLTTRGTIGNVILYNEKIIYPVVRINSSMLIVRSNQSIFNEIYLYEYFTSLSFQYQIKSFSTGSAQPQIPISILNNIKIICTSDKVLTDFSSKIKPIHESIQVLKNQNQNLKEARDILLPRLMTGVIEP